MLSGLSQTPSNGFGPPHMTAHQIAQHQYQHPLNDPGPSSHPRGPPGLGQIQQQGPQRTPPMSDARSPGSDGSPGDGEGGHGDMHGSPTASNNGGSGRARSGRAANMSNDEWARQRKDNHVRIPPLNFKHRSLTTSCRKKLNEEDVGTSTRGSTSLAGSFQTARARKLKARSYHVPCSISTI
jgi:hypothetical protein